MRLGVTVPIWGPQGKDLTGRHLVESAKRVEAAGFDSIWMTDTVNRGLPTLNPLLAAASIAAATSSIEIGTGVLQVGRLDGFELAHQLSTLSLLSDGRFTLGAGAGSTKGDFMGKHADFDHRFRALRDNLATVRRLTSGEEVDGVDLTPWPETIGKVPIVIGAWAGSRWIERAATEYDGWMGSGAKTSLEALLDGLSRFRDFGGVRSIAANLVVETSAPGGNLDTRQPFDLRCPLDEAKGRLALLADAGFTDAILYIFDHDEAYLAELRTLVD